MTNDHMRSFSLDNDDSTTMSPVKSVEKDVCMYGCPRLSSFIYLCLFVVTENAWFVSRKFLNGMILSSCASWMAVTVDVVGSIYQSISLIIIIVTIVVMTGKRKTTTLYNVMCSNLVHFLLFPCQHNNCLKCCLAA